MNILHMKYAVEVAKLGSLNKAAESLLIAQPNISRSIKELEFALGISIFTRSARGMVLTPEGEEFIAYAKKILIQIEELENHFKTGSTQIQKFSISVPPACYISEAFSRFSKEFAGQDTELYYNETESQRIVNEVVNNDCKLGIIRYSREYDKYFKAMLEDKGLGYEMIGEFSYHLVMNKEHTLANCESVLLSQLKPYIEVSYSDRFLPPGEAAKMFRERKDEEAERKIFVYDRATLLDIVSGNCEAFTWLSPVTKDILDKYGLVHVNCPERKRIYKDVLIYRKEYTLSKLDKEFITKLCEVRRSCIKD